MLLPLPPIVVPACQEFTWTVTPQISCKPVRLLLDKHTAHHVEISDIMVSHQSYVAAVGGSIPGSLFETENLDEILKLAALSGKQNPMVTNKVDFSFPIVQAGVPLTLRALNNSACSTRFLGTWVTVEEPFAGTPRLITEISASDGHLYALTSDHKLWKLKTAPESGWIEIPNPPPFEDTIAPTSYEGVWRHKESQFRLVVKNEGAVEGLSAVWDDGLQTTITEEKLLLDFERVRTHEGK